MTLFDFIFGKNHRCEDDVGDDRHACEDERRAIADRLRSKGLLGGRDLARVYLHYDEITPEIVTRFRLVVGYDTSYAIDIPDPKERAELAFLLKQYAQKYESGICLGARARESSGLEVDFSPSK